MWHGELTDMQRTSQTEQVDVEMGDQLDDMIHDIGQEYFQQAHAPMYVMCHYFHLFLNPFCHHFNYWLALIVKLIMQFYHLGLLD